MHSALIVDKAAHFYSERKTAPARRAHNPKVAGSFLSMHKFQIHASVAQLVEQRIRNAQVIGSSPIRSSKEPPVTVRLQGVLWPVIS